MSHAGDGEHDLDGIDGLDPETLKKLIIARELARKIINQAREDLRDLEDTIEPFHISSMADLIEKLKNHLKELERRQQMREAIE